MRFALALVVTFATVVVSAQNAFANYRPVTEAELATLPTQITCVSNAISIEAREFTIEAFNTADPSATISDQSTMDAPVVVDDPSGIEMLSLGFSNECDNDYGIVLPFADLPRLAKGEISSVKGRISYADYNGDESVDDGAVTQDDLELTCTLGAPTRL